MAYMPSIPTVDVGQSWIKTLPGPEKLKLERLESGRCYLRNSSNVRVARAILLDLDKRGAYISYLHVKKKHRRNGYGRRLVEALLQMARQMSCDGISLHVEVENAVAQKLFERVGFFICLTTSDGADYLMAQCLQR